jgi:hypothetical protein
MLDALQLHGGNSTYGFKSERKLDLVLRVEGEELLFAGE